MTESSLAAGVEGVIFDHSGGGITLTGLRAPERDQVRLTDVRELPMTHRGRWVRSGEGAEAYFRVPAHRA